MKKQELFNILIEDKTAYDSLTEEEMMNIMDDLASQFYNTGAPHPENVVIECMSISDN